MADTKMKISQIQLNDEKTYDIDAKYWGGHTIEDVKTINGKSIFGDEDIIVGSNSVLEIEYSNLKSLRDNSELVTGSKYKIIDYVTTTAQDGTQSAGHAFNLIVEALTDSTLSEDAKACVVDGDEYFGSSDLNSWSIKYCLDNDISRFSWADSTNGTGVIYYLKDEFNNEAWYDFKNIQFKRDSAWMNSYKSNYSSLSEFAESELWFFTFSRIVEKETDSTVSIEDDSFNKDISDENGIYPCRNNSIGAYSKNVNGLLRYSLNDTIFIGNGTESNHIGENNYNNTFVGIYDNYIDMNCQNNVVTSSFAYNHVGIGFIGNIIKAQFNYNTVGNRFKSNQLGSILYSEIKDNFHENNSYGKTIRYCYFGNGIQRCSDLPDMKNVIFEDEVVKYPENTYGKGLKDITLIDGKNAYDEISKLNDNTTQIIFTKKDDGYQIIDTFDNSIVISHIYNLGSVESSATAENVAKNANVGVNQKIALIKYYVSDKIGTIEQTVKNVDINTIETTQIIHWDGVSKIRKLKFSNVFGGNWTLIGESSWEELKSVTVKEWDAMNNKVFVPIYSNPNLDFESTSNNANCYGYVGSLKSVNVDGDLILIDSIAVYVREGEQSPNLDTPVWCRLLKFVNDTWEIVYQSTESKTIRGIAPETLFSFKMKAIDDTDKLIRPTDKIAIVYVDSEDAQVLSGIKLGFKAIINTGGGLQNVLANNSTGVSNWCPAFVFGYLSLASAKTGNQSFDGDIYIKDKTVIRSDIDAGELKVFNRNDVNAGFTVRTNGKFDNSIPKLELLATNNVVSYKYQFPELENPNDTDFVVVKSQLDKVIEEVSENERVTANALVYLNDGYEKVKKIANSIKDIDFENLVSVTYSELVVLRDNSQLVPGRQYRITDYVTTTSLKNTKSAGHQFDIILTALSESVLSEEAKAIKSDSDSDNYFEKANLSAWKIWYSLDNDTDRFEWAGSEREEVTYIENVDVLNTSNCEMSVSYSYDSEYELNKLDEYVRCVGKVLNDSGTIEEYIDALEVNELFSHFGYETDANGITQLTLYGRDIDGDLDGEYEDMGLNVEGNKYHYKGSYTIDDVEYDAWAEVAVGDFDGYAYFGDDDGVKKHVYALTEKIVTGEPMKVPNESVEIVTVEPKGVIYRMVDEWNNDCPYDFKNIQFIRCITLNDEVSGGMEILSVGGDNYAYCYTFSCVNTDDLNIYDASIDCNHVVKGESVIASGVHDNVIKSYIYNSDIDYENSKIMQQHLNNIVFFDTMSYSDGMHAQCYSNIFGNNCYNNTFGYYCFENSFGSECFNNIFGNMCSTNKLENCCNDNSFGHDCYDNIFRSKCSYIVFGKSCSNNKFGIECSYNSFGDNCYSNSFGDNCSRNNFGDECNDNKFGAECYENILGDGCNTNTFGAYCTNNTFGEGCAFNSFKDGAYKNTFESGCNCNRFGSDCHENTFGVEFEYNTFGNDCKNNTFGEKCKYNTFGTIFKRNTFGNECVSNDFLCGCCENTFGNTCVCNTFGKDCLTNIFGNTCSYNTFGSEFQTNSLGDEFLRNSFGNCCGDNTFGNGCKNNSFGNNCISNTLGTVCESNSFGNGCNYNNFGDNCSANSLGNKCSYNGFKIGNNIGFNNSDRYIATDTDIPFVTNVHYGDGCKDIVFCCNDEFGESNSIKNLNIQQGLVSNNTETTESGETYGSPTFIDITPNTTGVEITVTRNSSGNIVKFCLADLLNQ